MEEGRPSATAEIAAIARARHQNTGSKPRILDDPIAPRLVDPDGPAYKACSELLERVPTVTRLRLTFFLLRSRYAEDCLAEAFARGLRQYVILGAGLDTFAYRQPALMRDLQIFEVDHPATQQWKRRRLSDARITIPENARLVPVDFERTTLKAALPEAGLDPAAPAFFSMLGVSQYLIEEALNETLNMVQAIGPSSEIVFSFVLPDDALPDGEAGLARQLAQRFAAIGEPWLTRPVPDQLKRKLQKMGFSMVSHLSPEDANRVYFRSRQDGLSAPLLEQMMTRLVPPTVYALGDTDRL
jgi:methyltransferase (TIGR00027 family)